MPENFPNLVKDIILQIQNAEQTHKKDKSKKSTPREIIIKILKTKVINKLESS